MPKKRVHLKIEGKVQGVGFRANTRGQARKLGLTGWVKNLADGSVEAVIEGEKEKVESLVSWAQQGPRMANVKDIEVDWQDPSSEFESFSIRY